MLSLIQASGNSLMNLGGLSKGSAKALDAGIGIGITFGDGLFGSGFRTLGVGLLGSGFLSSGAGLPGSGFRSTRGGVL